ncbi:MAG: Ig-like domain-containing protein [Bacteroidales bacterium]
MTLALICALSPVPLSAQSAGTIVGGKLVKDLVVVGSGTLSASTAATDYVRHATFSQTVSTNGYTITVQGDGTLTIANGATLTLIKKTSTGTAAADNPLFINGGEVLNSGTIKVASAAIDLIGEGKLTNVTQTSKIETEAGSGGINVWSADASIENHGVIDLSKGGALSVATGATAATDAEINSPGIILAASTSSFTTPPGNLSKFTGFVRYATSKVINALKGTADDPNVWTNWHTNYYTAGYTLNVLSYLTVPATATLTVPAKTPTADALTVTPTGVLTVEGTVEVEAGAKATVNSGASGVYQVLLRGTSRVTIAEGALLNNDGKITIEAGAYVNNLGIISHNQSGGASTLYNNSADVHSPGLILAGKTIEPTGGGAAIPLAEGFVKYTDDNGSTYKIDVYGSGNVWKSWLNEFFNNGTIPTTGHPYSGMTINNAAYSLVTGSAELHLVNAASTLTIPDGTTLAAATTAWVNIWSGELIVQKGGALTVTSSPTAGVGLKIDAHQGVGKLTIEEGATVTVGTGTNVASLTAGEETTIANGGTLTLGGTGSAAHSIGGLLDITGKGKVTLSAETELTATSRTVVETAEGSIVASANLTASSGAKIENNGKIQVTGGELENGTTQITGTGLIEISGSGTTITLNATPEQHVIVNTTGTASSPLSARSINVYGGPNPWTTLLQAYLTDKKVETVAFGKDAQLDVNDVKLLVPENWTLTINGPSNTSSSPDYDPEALYITSRGVIESKGLTILGEGTTPFALTNIEETILKQGFIQTGNSLITAYGEAGTKNTWNNYLQGKFNGTNISVLLIPEEAELDYSSYDLYITSGRTVLNEGTLTGTGSKLHITGGELRKGAKSETPYIPLTSITGGGRINAELRPEWVAWNTEQYDSAAYQKVFTLTDKGATREQNAGYEYTLDDEDDYTISQLTDIETGVVLDKLQIEGIEATGTTSSRYGYYGTVDRDYYPVDYIALDKHDRAGYLLAEGATTTLTANIVSEGPEGEYNPNILKWQVNYNDEPRAITYTAEGATAEVTALISPTAVLPDTLYAISVERHVLDKGELTLDTTYTVFSVGAIEQVVIKYKDEPVTENTIIDLIGRSKDGTTAEIVVAVEGAGENVVQSLNLPAAIAPTPPEKQTITVEPVSGVANTYTLQSTIIRPQNGTDEQYTYTVTLASAIAPDVTADVKVRILPVPVSGVTLTDEADEAVPEALTLTVGDEPLTLKATITPPDAANKNVSWKITAVEPAGAVTLSETTGLTNTVTAVAAGTAVITATTADGNKTATVTVTVNPLRATGIESIKEIKEEGAEALDGSYHKVSSTIAISALVAPTKADASTSLADPSTYTVSWTIIGAVTLTPDATDQTKVTVTPTEAGEVKVTATLTDNEDADNPTVIGEPKTVSFTAVAVSISGGDALTITSYEDGRPTNYDNLQLTPDIKPADAVAAFETAWESSNPAVAELEVDEEGEVKVDEETGAVTVKAVSAGEATITLTVKEKATGKTFTTTATHEVTVTAKTEEKPPVTVPVTGIEISGISAEETLQVGKTLQLGYRLKPELAEGEEYEDCEVTWSSEHGNVSVDKVTGLVTAVAAGTDSIYATVTITEEKKFVDTAAITVTAAPVPPVPVEGVHIAAISTSAKGLQVGDSLELSYTILPAKADAATYDYDEVVVSAYHGEGNVVSIAQGDEGKAKVKAVAAGADSIIVTITAGEKTFADTIAITVYWEDVTGVTIAGAESTGLQKGATLQLHWSIAPVNANNQAVTWKTLYPTVAEVSDSGKVTAKADGETKLIVTTEEGDYTDTVVVTVYTVHPDKVIISGAEAINLQKTKTLQLHWSVLPANANNKEVTWKSLNASIASVDSGKVTAKADGETQLVVTTVDSARTDTIDISVYSIPIEGVRIADKGNLPALQMTNTLQLTAGVLPAEANDWQGVTWRSYDPAIATIDKYGVVTGVSGDEEGDTAMIVATAVGTTFRDTVYIKVYTVYVEGISITENTGAVEELAIRRTLQLHATVEPLNATNHDKTWKSDNKAVATVDANGLVTGVSEGEANIVVTSAESKEFTDTLRLKVYKIDVESVTIDNMPDSLATGATVELVASVEPPAPTDTVVTWRSGNAAIAQVDAAGKVTGVSAGETYIIAASDGKQDSLTIKVYNVPVSGVSIAAADSLAVGDTLRLHATIEPANATNQAVTWSSDNDLVATVDAAGLVTGVSAGEAHIFVTTVDGGLKDSVLIKVYTIAVEGVTIAAAVDSVGVGHTLKLTAKVTPDNATDKSVTWSSGNTAVATVSSAGTVTGRTAGETYIYVTTVDGGYKDSVAIRVYTEEVVPQPIPVTGVTIAGATDSLKADSTLQLTAVITPEDADNKTVTWSSSDAAVATVDNTGLVTGVAEGEAIITVTTEDGEFTASVTIAVYTEEVVPQPIPVEGVTLDKETATLAIDETLQLTYAIEPADADVEYSVAWSSDNEAVATVADGVVTAIAEGEAIITITVTTEDGEFTASVTITVEEGDGVEVPVTSVKAYIAENTLYVNSAVTEKVDIYTISGNLVYSAVKPAGEVQIALYSLSDGVLIIRGASGWVQKIVK